jgi:hypothetical protein
MGCGHPADRKLTGIPDEYAGMCDCCLIKFAAATGLFFDRKDAKKAAPEREAGS